MEFQTLLSHIRYPPCWGYNRCGVPDILKTPNISIIDDIKNIIINQTNENIDININTNKTKEKIGIAFIYSTLYSNGIARFITVTSKNLFLAIEATCSLKTVSIWKSSR